MIFDLNNKQIKIYKIDEGSRILLMNNNVLIKKMFWNKFEKLIIDAKFVSYIVIDLCEIIQTKFFSIRKIGKNYYSNI